LSTRDLGKRRRDEEADSALRKHFFENAGQGMSEFDIDAYLSNRTDMVAFLSVAAEEGDREIISIAVADVMQAMTAQTSVEYLRARGALGDATCPDAGEQAHQPGSRTVD
jgi:predicted transcriptional regulator